eukprot:SAG22_NODE_12910_length_425_cov_0.788344_1_plen_21_part_10
MLQLDEELPVYVLFESFDFDG